MIKQIYLTKESTKQAQYLSSALGLRPNITSRNALLYSLNKKDRCTLKDCEKLDQGMEIKSSALFGDSIDIYEMLLKEYYGNQLGKFNIEKLISFHVSKRINDDAFVNTLKDKI